MTYSIKYYPMEMTSFYSLSTLLTRIFKVMNRLISKLQKFGKKQQAPLSRLTFLYFGNCSRDISSSWRTLLMPSGIIFRWRKIRRFYPNLYEESGVERTLRRWCTANGCFHIDPTGCDKTVRYLDIIPPLPSFILFSSNIYISRQLMSLIKKRIYCLSVVLLMQL